MSPQVATNGEREINCTRGIDIGAPSKHVWGPGRRASPRCKSAPRWSEYYTTALVLLNHSRCLQQYDGEINYCYRPIVSALTLAETIVVSHVYCENKVRVYGFTDILI